VPEPLRIVQTALEVDAVGVPFWRAVTAALEQGGVAALLGLLADTPGENRAAGELWQHLATPDRVRALLSADDADFQALAPILDRMEPAELAPLLLDVLMAAESRSLRLAAFKRLGAMELPVLEPLVRRGLADERWYVQRNMLALLNEKGVFSRAVPVDALVRHPDPRVRREALVLWMRSPLERDRALCLALADPDERTLRAAVAEAHQGVPGLAVPLLARRALDPLPADLRCALLRLLRGHEHPVALDALMRTASTGRSMLGRYRLAPRSAEALTALTVLADTWAAHPQAAALLARARGSADPELRAAAGAAEAGP
jgi:hypothetical protein